MENGKSLARICGWSSWPVKRKPKEQKNVGRHVTDLCLEKFRFGFVHPFVSTTSWASSVWIAAIRAVPISSFRTWSRPTARQIHLCDSHVGRKLPLSWWTALDCVIIHQSTGERSRWRERRKKKLRAAIINQISSISFSFFLFLTVSHPIPIPSISHSFILSLSKQALGAWNNGFLHLVRDIVFFCLFECRFFLLSEFNKMK